MKGKVKSTTVAGKNRAIIGVFDGECADGRLTNENGLDIPDEVWINLFNSEEFKRGIENGYYIGYLGHPESDDPGVQNFMNGCIVMIEGHIDEKTGKVYGKFNLIDTPVGRIVKTFIDAGVKFGISVRGAGDIVNNSVDPETFCFRGFDLVAFPAFPDAVPEFSEIAASSDVTKQSTYKKICAAVTSNLDGIDQASSLDIIKCHFAKQSDVYSAIERRKEELENGEDDDIDIESSQLEAMTQLYLEASDANRQLVQENEHLRSQIDFIRATYDKKIDRLRSITSSQLTRLSERVRKITASTSVLRSANGKLKNEVEKLESRNQSLISSNKKLGLDLDKVNASIDSLKSENSRLQEKLTRSDERRRDLKAENSKLQNNISASKSKNLNYKQKVTANQKLIDDKDKIIAQLESDLDKTVVKASRFEKRTSNLGDQVNSLKSENLSLKDQLAEYREAYANLYATAVGVDLKSIPITASTKVGDIHQLVSASVDVVDEDYTDLDVDDVIYCDDDELVTI